MGTTLQPQDIRWRLYRLHDIMFTIAISEKMEVEITPYLYSCTYHCENQV